VETVGMLLILKIKKSIKVKIQLKLAQQKRQPQIARQDAHAINLFAYN
jgi:hypothetical protein